MDYKTFLKTNITALVEYTDGRRDINDGIINSIFQVIPIIKGYTISILKRFRIDSVIHTTADIILDLLDEKNDLIDMHVIDIWWAKVRHQLMILIKFFE